MISSLSALTDLLEMRVALIISVKVVYYDIVRAARDPINKGIIAFTIEIESVYFV
jgi:hypothetical protein